MKSLIYFFSILLISILVLSCSSDSAQPAPNTPPPSSTKISYTNDVAPIINSKCIGCHGNPPAPGPMSLTTLDNVKDAILNRGLIDRISRAQGTAGMMPNGGTRLPQSDIDKIIKWQTDGFPQ